MRLTSLRFLLAPLVALGLAHSHSRDGGEPLSVPPESPASPDARLADASELWAHPSRYVGQRVTITAQTHSRPETWNPFMTRFGPGEYACFRAWSDEQHPWLAEDYERPLVRAFARRGSAAEWALDGAERYQRFELSCEVRAVFGDVPWLEVVGVKPLVRRLGDGIVMHAQRAVELMEKELWQTAHLELGRALNGALPPLAREELERLRGIAEENRDANPRVPRR